MLWCHVMVFYFCRVLMLCCHVMVFYFCHVLMLWCHVMVFYAWIIASALRTLSVAIKEITRCSCREKKGAVASRPHVKENDGPPFTHSFVHGNRRPRPTRVKLRTWPLTRQLFLLYLKHNPDTSLILSLWKSALITPLTTNHVRFIL